MNTDMRFIRERVKWLEEEGQSLYDMLDPMRLEIGPLEIDEDDWWYIMINELQEKEVIVMENEIRQRAKKQYTLNINWSTWYDIEDAGYDTPTVSYRVPENHEIAFDNNEVAKAARKAIHDYMEILSKYDFYCRLTQYESMFLGYKGSSYRDDDEVAAYREKCRIAGLVWKFYEAYGVVDQKALDEHIWSFAGSDIEGVTPWWSVGHTEDLTDVEEEENWDDDIPF